MEVHAIARGAAVAAAAAAALAAAGCGSTKTKVVTRTVTVTAPAATAKANARAAVPSKTLVPAFAGDPAATKVAKSVGIDKVLAQLPKAKAATSTTVTPHLEGALAPGNKSLPAFMSTISNDVSTFWEGILNQAGYRWDPITQDILLSGTGRTKCNPGSFSVSDGPFYCSADPAIHLPAGFFATEAAPIGDDAVAIVIAHEWGHRVQDVLGAFQGGFKSKQIELSADCLGGIWSYGVYERGLLSKGDIQEALTITNDAGDAPGTNENGPGAHGSSAERVASFLKGFQSGDPNACAPRNFS